MKRICLLAGFHPKGQISDYVIYYAQALSQLADVYYMADCEMPEPELKKLAPYVKGAWAKRHGKYDFGSWQELISKLGWEFITQYDECIFANDSVFAPLFPLAPIFERAAKDTPLDAWGINAYDLKYIESYFFILRRNVLLAEACRQFFENIVSQTNVAGVIEHYEKGLTDFLCKNGFNFKVLRYAQNSLAGNWRTFIKQGVPFLKVKNFIRAHVYIQYVHLPGWRRFLAKYTRYPVSLIEQHLRSIGVDPEQFDSFGFKLKSLYWCLRRWRQKIIRLHFYKKERIVVLFGWTVVSTSPKPTPQIKEF